MPRALLVMVLFLIGGCLAPQGWRPSFEVSALAATQYNRRGMVENERGVAQGEAKTRLPVPFGGAFQLKAWANMDLTQHTGDAWFPDGHGGEVTEVDLTGSYGRPVGPLDLSAGWTTYVLPHGNEFLNGDRPTTGEVFAAIGADVLPESSFGFYPLFIAFYDPVEVDGFYLNAGVSKGWGLTEDLRLILGASLGYSEENHSLWTYGFEAAGFTDLRGTLTLEYRVTDTVTLAAGVAASTILDDEIREWVEHRAIVERRSDGTLKRGIDTDTVWGTLGVSWRF